MGSASGSASFSAVVCSFSWGMKDRDIKPTSVRLERPLYEALSGLSQAVDLPVGKLLRLAVIDYIGRLETGVVRLSQLGESSGNKDGVGRSSKNTARPQNPESPPASRSSPMRWRRYWRQSKRASPTWRKQGSTDMADCRFARNQPALLSILRALRIGADRNVCATLHQGPMRKR